MKYNPPMIALILFAMSFSMQSQHLPIDYIKFEYSISNIVCENVEIFLERGSNAADKGLATIRYCKNSKEIEKKIPLSKIEFDRITTQFEKVNNSNIVKNFSLGLDGSSTTFEVGQFFSNSITFRIWSLDKFSNNSNNKELVSTIQMILKVVDFKIPNFN